MVSVNAYLSCIKNRPCVYCTHVFAEIVGSTKGEQLFLADTGATVSLMPMSLYCTIHPDMRYPLYIPDRNIYAANGSKIDCKGMAVVKVNIGGINYPYKYYVCTDTKIPIFGADFMHDYDMYCRLRAHCIYLGDRELPAFDGNGYCREAQILLAYDSTIPPNAEAVLYGTVDGVPIPDGTNLMLTRHETTIDRTGALVARVIAKPKRGLIPIRVLNSDDEPLHIKAGSLMADAETIISVKPFGDVFEKDEYDLEPCTCDCNCSASVRTLLTEPVLREPEPVSSIPKSRRIRSRKKGTASSASTGPSQHGSCTVPPLCAGTVNCIGVEPNRHNDRTVPSTSTSTESSAGPELNQPETCTVPTTCTSTTPCCHAMFDKTVPDRYSTIVQHESTPPKVVPKGSRWDRSMIPEHVLDLYDRSCEDLNQDQRTRLASLLIEYQDRFAAHPDDVGRTTLIKHHIDTGDAAPVRQRCRRFAKCHIEAIQEHVKKLADAGIIRPSTSEWASNCVVVKKKDGTWRLCIDYRELNEKTKNPDSYLLPRIDDTLDALAGAKKFCTLDLIQGYHQVELTESSKEKTAFHAPFVNPSQWEFSLMPFGLVKAPRTFQRLMDRVIQGLEYRVALAYLDDIIIFGTDVDSCMDSMKLVLERLRHANLKLKAKKCTLFANEVEYLGHVISGKGVMTDPKKIEAVKEWHPPRTTKGVRSILGMATYYNRFIKNFSDVANPLQDLLKKGIKFHWEERHQKAFELLQKSLITAPIMAYPQHDCMFILDTDASDRCYGAVLSQLQSEDDGTEEERVIAYASKKFSKTEQMYCARRRELLAIVRFVKYFNVYLRGPTFLIRTDHASLRYIKTVRELPAQFFRWIMFLEEYSYKIEIRKGVLHGNADAMSRGCHGKGCICDDLVRWEQRMDVRKGTVMIGSIVTTECPVAASEPTPVNVTCSIGGDGGDDRECFVAAIKLQPKYTIKELAAMQEDDPDVGPVLKALRTNPDERPKWNQISDCSAASKAYFAEWKRLCLYQDALYRLWENNAGTRIHRQLIVPRKLQQEFCEKVHDTARTAHMGRRRMIHALQHFCFWYRMYEDALWWIKSCTICQERKKLHPAPKAPMTVYVPGEPGERISIDICGPMIETPRGNRFVLVISDHFTKYTKAVPLPDQQAETVAQALIDHWILEYGEPMQLHSDQGRNFESNLIKQFCELHGIEKTRTTAYHPQADGQVERFNKTLIDLICKLPGLTVDWDLRAPVSAMSYNSTVHDSTGYSPNMLMKGREIRHTQGKIIPDPDTNKPTTYHEYVKKLKENYVTVFDSTRKALRKSAIVQKKYYDRKANLYQYKPGQPVWITSHKLAEPGTKKFRREYVGPWWIIDVLSDIHFRIQEFEFSHPRIIHHDRMKPYIFRTETPTPEWAQKASRDISAAKLAKAAERRKEQEAVPAQSVPLMPGTAANRAPVPPIASTGSKTREPSTSKPEEVVLPAIPPSTGEPTRKRKPEVKPVPKPRRTKPLKRTTQSVKRQRTGSPEPDEARTEPVAMRPDVPSTVRTEPTTRTRSGREVKPNPKYS